MPWTQTIETIANWAMHNNSNPKDGNHSLEKHASPVSLDCAVNHGAINKVFKECSAVGLVGITAALAVLLASASIVGLGFLAWPFGDDFAHYSVLHTRFLNPCLSKGGATSCYWYSFLQEMEYWYLTLSGRVTSNILICLKAFLPLGKANVLIGLFSSVLVISAYVVSSLVVHSDNRASQRHFVMFAFLFSIWFGMPPEVFAESTYFLTGSVVYLTPLFLGLLWLRAIYVLVVSPIEKEMTWYYLPLWLGWGVATGACMETLSPALIFVSLALLLLYRPSFGFQNKVKFSSLNLGVIIGTMFMISAPGTTSRRAVMANSTAMPNFNELMDNYISLVSKFLELSVWVVVFSLVSGMCLFMIFSAHQERVTKEVHAENRRAAGEGVVWLSAAFVSIMPLAFIVGYTPARTGYFFFIFVCVAILRVFAAPTHFFSAIWSRWLHRAGLVGVLSLSLFFFKSGVEEWRAALPYKREVQRRHEFLNLPTNRNQAVYVKPITVARPIRSHDAAIPGDRSHWISLSYADAYGLMSVSE